MIQVDKLVRDNVCKNLEKKGIAKTVECHTVEGREYQTYLFSKLMEECAEVIGANTKQQRMEEIGDLEQVIDAIKEHFGIDRKECSYNRIEKYTTHGGFYNGVVMTGIEYND